ncbi:hypothetical protein V1525DRAFT_395594 [Lipomyces kononenkoae]|uniref:Uncharacterized protein n=1 Tax=Lipomyces kononenkoae TaxID=34357 RepID=A0ACC3T8P4_LIPKO
MATQTPEPIQAKPNNRSKRILITTHSFPRHHAPLSRRYAVLSNSSNTADFSNSSHSSDDSNSSVTNPYPQTESFEYYSNAARSECRHDMLPQEVQSSLVQVGMKIRKSVNEGYKLPIMDEKECVVSQRAERAWSDTTLVNPYVNSPHFQSVEYSRERQFGVSKKRGRSLDMDESDEEPDEGMVSDSDTVVDDDMARADSSDNDFVDAPFLMPKDVVMSM